jgi:hypothetical protein
LARFIGTGAHVRRRSTPFDPIEAVTPLRYDRRMLSVPTPTVPSATRAPASDIPTVGDITSALRRSDELIASAVRMIGRFARAGGMERATDLPAELTLRLAARRTSWEAAELVGASDLLAGMPRTEAAMSDGLVSWSQARAICRACRVLPIAARAEVDALVAAAAPAMVASEPDALVWQVDAKVDVLRADLARRREQRAIEGGFLVLQPRIDGHGGTMYAEADTESFATIAQAVDASIPRPANPADLDAPSPGRQRLDALVAVCESSLSGAPDGTRPGPRLIATIDVRDLVTMGLSEGARVLAAVAGRPLKLTPLATEILSCDADVVPVVFDGARPIGVGNAIQTIPAKVRTALIARDGGCRFPGCGAPVAWCDAHHIVLRSEGGAASVDNLLLLCRRCHRRVHRHRWRIRLEPDGGIAFSRGRTFTSVSRTRPPPRK